MPKQQEEIREIKSYIKSWILDIDFSIALNYSDINKVSEGICLKLLNLIYGYELQDLGKEQYNFPAVDLGDCNSSKIAFQITSDTTMAKIRESLKKFKHHGLDKRFIGGIKFLILDGRRKRKAVIEGYEDFFEMGRDVLYLSDLIREIACIYWDDHNRFLEIKDFLKSEFGDSNHKEPSLIFPDESNKINHYLEVVKKLNAPEVNNLAHFDVEKHNGKYCTEVLFEESFPENRVIIGESGYGKSIMARSWAMALCSKGFVPLILKTKCSGSGLSDFIEKEMGRYGFPSALSFIKACRSSEKKILLVLDGLNECTSETAERLVAELKELSCRYEILFIITTQQLTESLKELEAEIIKVSKPDFQLRIAIAAKYSNSISKLEPILDMVSTSMEARMVGEIGIFGVDKISRYSLFELFVRRKLKGTEKDGIYFLSAIARKMSQEISFCISLRQVDNILLDTKIETHILESCLSTGILVKDFAQISFSHEMLLNFFTADSIARFSADSQAVIHEFNAPRNDEKRLLIIGSIEDSVLREKILESIGDTDLLLLLLDGEAGEYCQCWAAEKLKEVLAKMQADSATIKFLIEAEQHPQVMIKKGSIPKWKYDELAFVEIIIHQMLKGKLLDELFLIAGVMDECLDSTFKIMLAEAREKKVGLRDGLFQSIYSPLNGKSITVTGMSYLFSCLGSGFTSLKTENEITFDNISRLAASSNLKSGQFYLLLLLCRFNERAKALYDLILDGLSEHWDYLSWTLKNEILTAVPYCHDTDRERTELIGTIMKINSKKTNYWLSTALFDTLNSLGALDSDAENYEETVMSDLNVILSNPNCEKSWQQASFMFNAQFDHPYGSAFYNSIEGLDESAQKTFYTMAIKHDDDFDLFLSMLLLSAERILRAECCPHLLKIMDRPIIEATMSKERIKNYIIVCIILANYRYDFVSIIENRQDEGEKILVCLAEILYWINRKDMENKQIMEKCKPTLSILFDSPSPYLIDSIKEFNNAFMQIHLRDYFNENIITLEAVFADCIVSACRFSLKSKNALSIFKYYNNAQDIYRYAVDQIGLYGNINDMTALKEIADDVVLGKSAVRAIKNIDKKGSR